VVVSVLDCIARLRDFAIGDLIRRAFWFGDGAGEAAAAAAATSAHTGRSIRIEGASGGAAAAEASGDRDVGAGAEAVAAGLHPEVSKLLSLRLYLRLLVYLHVLLLFSSGQGWGSVCVFKYLLLVVHSV
jgi:hypothetical protein